MTETVFDIGQLVTSECRFKNSAGALANPTAVYCQVQPPSGASTSYQYGVGVAIVRDSTGIYHINIDASVAGTWTVRWYSTGTGQAVDARTFAVKPSPITT